MAYSIKVLFLATFGKHSLIILVNLAKSKDYTFVKYLMPKCFPCLLTFVAEIISIPTQFLDF